MILMMQGWKKNKICFKNAILLIVVFFVHLSSNGQGVWSHDDLLKSEIQFYKKRDTINYPKYGLKKIKTLVISPLERVPKDQAPVNINVAISDLEFQKLSAEEKFTYCMIHPEIYSQTCHEPLYFREPHKKIFGSLVDFYPMQTWSDRQLNYMRSIKKKNLLLFEETIKDSKVFGMNMKSFLIEIDAWEEIPFLIQYFKNNPNDNDVLTILMLLMKNGEFTPFLQSKIYKKIFANDDYFSAWVVTSKANIDHILMWSDSYYKTKEK